PLVLLRWTSAGLPSAVRLVTWVTLPPGSVRLTSCPRWLAGRLVSKSAKTRRSPLASVRVKGCPGPAWASCPFRQEPGWAGPARLVEEAGGGAVADRRHRAGAVLQQVGQFRIDLAVAARAGRVAQGVGPAAVLPPGDAEAVRGQVAVGHLDRPVVGPHAPVAE